MGKRRGRTARRREKASKGSSFMTPHAFRLGYDRVYVGLMQWMQKNGFRKRSTLFPAHFPDTGRGLMTSRPVTDGELIVSIPAALLITTSTVMSSSIGMLIKRWQRPITALECLCLFLVYEHHIGHASDWVYYIDVLPDTYTNALYWEKEELDILPADVQEAAVNQLEEASASFNSIQPLGVFMEQQCPRLRGGLSWQRYRWAWSSINTRSVYMKQAAHSPCIRDPDKDCYALAPFLDLLNHSADVQVDAGFSHKNNSYEIRAVSPSKRYEQVFISYGPHDNSRLLVEYGFIVPRNKHNVVKVYLDELLELENFPFVNFFDEKLTFIKENELYRGMLWSEEGMSWNLRLALEIIAIDSNARCEWQKWLHRNESDDLSEHVKALASHLLRQRTEALRLPPQIFNRELNYKEQLAVELRQQQLALVRLNEDKIA